MGQRRVGQHVLQIECKPQFPRRKCRFSFIFHLHKEKRSKECSRVSSSQVVSILVAPRNGVLVALQQAQAEHHTE